MKESPTRKSTGYRYTMTNLTSGFCPRCGAPTEDGGLCGKCKAKDLVWAEIPERLECTICPTCGSVKTSGMWADSAVERDTIAYAIAKSAIKIHKDVTDVQTSIHIREASSNRSFIDVLVLGNLYGIPVERSAKIKFVWIHEQCDRCSRIAGSYYEGVIQVRAAGRLPTAFEKTRCAKIAYQLEDQMQNAGDRLAFVSDIEEIDGGIDITFSTQAIGNLIARDITGALGGSYTTHPKLIGEKNGTRLYRVTYSLRLPRFARGDVIFRDKTWCKILRQTKDTLFVQDLTTGLTRSFREDDEDPLLGNVNNAETAEVIYKDAGILGILDPADGSVHEIPDRQWMNAAPGDSVLFLRGKETLTAVAKKEPDESSELPDEHTTTET